MIAAGILTAHGGMTSHAAVVAREHGHAVRCGLRGALGGCEGEDGVLHGKQIAEGDVLTLDGGTGRVILGPVDLVRRRSTRTSRRFSAGPTRCGA